MFTKMASQRKVFLHTEFENYKNNDENFMKKVFEQIKIRECLINLKINYLIAAYCKCMNSNFVKLSEDIKEELLRNVNKLITKSSSIGSENGKRKRSIESVLLTLKNACNPQLIDIRHHLEDALNNITESSAMTTLNKAAHLIDGVTKDAHKVDVFDNAQASSRGFVVPRTATLDGGRKKSSPKPSEKMITRKGKQYKIYVGPRGGEYIKNAGKWQRV